MALVALACLVAGTVCGLRLFPAELSALISEGAEPVLWLLMFAVGIGVGLSKDVFRKIREYRLGVAAIPLGIIAASAAAGVLCAPLTGRSLSESVAITSGMGWYSLSGIMITDLMGAEAGAVAFLGNLLRELFSFLVIPWVAKHLNHYAAIAPAGATSEDTTLALILRCTREELVVLSVMNGILCSAAVPFLIRAAAG